MSILTPITRLALLAAAGGIAYTGLTAAIPEKELPPVEPGYVNPGHVELYTPVNETGNVELFLEYDNGFEQNLLPIMVGLNGPSIGTSDYQWGNMDDETKEGFVQEGFRELEDVVKSDLVSESWGDVLSATKLGILRDEFDKLLEHYGE